MKLTRWEPFLGVNRMQRELDQLLQELVPEARQSVPAVPRLNLWEDEDQFYVEAELPGFSLDDLEVSVEGNQLSIQGERSKPADEAQWHRRERRYGTLQRTVELPTDVDADRVSATLTHGILTVSLAKAEATKPRKITVRTE